MWNRIVEKEDLRLLLACVVAIPLTWLFFLGGHLDAAIMSNDAHMALPRVRDLMQQTGDWTRMLYRADLMGGIVVSDIWGKNWAYRVAGLFGLSPVGAMNFAAILMQIGFSFLGVRIVRDLARLWVNGSEEQRLSWVEIVSLVLTFAFLPLIGARLMVGHLDLLLGFLLFPVLVAAITGIRSGTLTVTFFVLSTLSLLACFPSHGHQTKLYSVVFGFPVLLVLIFWPRPVGSDNGGWRTLWKPVGLVALLLGSAFALSLPKFAGMVNAAGNSDSVRGLDGESMIFSFMTSTLQDWWVSITWNPNLFHSDRGLGLLAEVAFGFGPFLLLVPALVALRLWPLATALLVSGLLAVAFSINFEPIVNLLTNLVPPLHAFRVPGRAILPFVFSLTAAGLAVILSLNRGASSQIPWKAAVAVLPLFILPEAGREVFLWLLCAIVLFMVLRPNWGRRHMGNGTLLVLLAVGCLQSSHPWLRNFRQTPELLTSMESVGAQLFQNDAQLGAPLVRVAMEADQRIYGVHTALAMGLSNVAGYWNPTRRWLDLLGELNGKPYSAAAVHFQLNSKVKGFPVLQQLYNIRSRISPADNSVRVETLPQTAGATWFSRNLVFEDSMQGVVKELSANAGALRNYFALRTVVVRNDPKTTGLDPAAVSETACASAHVQGLEQAADRQTFRLKVETTGLCPLTLAMNYAEVLKAYAVDGETELPLQTFPSYGVLTGVLIPPGTREVVVRAEPFVPGWALAAWWFGLLGFGGALAGLVLSGSGALKRRSEGADPVGRMRGPAGGRASDRTGDGQDAPAKIKEGRAATPSPGSGKNKRKKKSAGR